MNQYEIEITGNGVWRNLNPEYVVFDDHVKEGEHRCAECRCSFCGKPSVYNYQKVKDKVVPGKVGGHQYCKPCMIIDYNKFLKQNIWEKENEKRELDLDLEKKWSDLIELADDITEYEEIEAELWSSGNKKIDIIYIYKALIQKNQLREKKINEERIRQNSLREPETLKEILAWEKEQDDRQLVERQSMGIPENCDYIIVPEDANKFILAVLFVPVYLRVSITREELKTYKGFEQAVKRIDRSYIAAICGGWMQWQKFRHLAI